MLADPTDARLAVWADARIEAGDPRGEFVSLQLADARGALGARGRARMEALLRTHRADWLGPLAAVVDAPTCGFERGLLTQAWVRPRRGAALDLDDPAWSVVTQLQSSTEHLRRAPAVRRSGMRLTRGDGGDVRGPEGFTLRRVRPPAWRQLGELASGRPLPLESVCVGLPPYPPGRDDRVDEDRLRAGLPALHTVHLVETWARAPLSERGTSRLGSIAGLLRCVPEAVIDGVQLAYGEPDARWWDAFGAHLRALTVIGPDRRFSVTWRRADDGVHLTLSKHVHVGFEQRPTTPTGIEAARRRMRAQIAAATHPLDAWASVAVRSRPIPAYERAVLEEVLGAARAVVLPPARDA